MAYLQSITFPKETVMSKYLSECFLSTDGKLLNGK